MSQFPQEWQLKKGRATGRDAAGLARAQPARERGSPSRGRDGWDGRRETRRGRRTTTTTRAVNDGGRSVA